MGVAIYSLGAAWHGMSEMTLGQWLTDTCPTIGFQTHAAAWLGLQVKLTPSSWKGYFLAISSQGRTRIVIEHARGQLSSFTLTPLNSAVVPMTQWKKMKPMKKLSLRASLSSLIIFKEPPMSSMTSYIFRGRLRQLNRIPWDFYPCYPVNLRNTLVPQPYLSSILQN
jgi:hypothetical protein